MLPAQAGLFVTGTRSVAGGHGLILMRMQPVKPLRKGPWLG